MQVELKPKQLSVKRDRGVHVGHNVADTDLVQGWSATSRRSGTTMSTPGCRDLTEAHLEKLGVASLGHRKILRRAMEALRRPLPDLGDGANAVASEATPPPSASRSEAERRQLTVLFCNIVGSTALAARLDPEDLRGIMGAYHCCTAAVVERSEGHVAKYLVDQV